MKLNLEVFRTVFTRRTIILLVCIVGVGSNLLAQSLVDLKYIHYRERLRKYFMKIGTAPGESLISNNRNHNWMESNPPDPNLLAGFRSNAIMDFADQTITLGNYIGVLATEYHLFKLAGINTDQTVKELYYALYAFNRLDLAAEDRYGYPSNLDGFFVREDTPNNFLEDPTMSSLNESIDPPLTPDVNYISGSGQPIWVETFRGWNETRNSGSAMSQDQVYGMLVGLALLKKFVPEEVSYPSHAFQDSRSGFVDEAQQITYRIFTRMANDLFVVKAPDNSYVGAGEEYFDNNNFAIPFSYGFAEACSFIDPVHRAGYVGNFIPANNYGIWQSMQEALGAADFCSFYGQNWENCVPQYNERMALDLAAVCNCWERPDIATNTTQSQIYKHSIIYGWENYYLLLGKALHGNEFGILLLPQQPITDMLNNAPWDGPFFHGTNDKASFLWAAQHRFRSTKAEQENGDPNGTMGNFSGIDYMLLHNLYKIVYRPGLPECSVDIIDGNNNKVYNNDRVIKGNNEDHYQTSIKNEEGVKLVIHEDANVWWTAGEYIEFNEGFETQEGAEFTAEIMGCDPLYPLFSRQGNPEDHEFSESGTQSKCIIGIQGAVSPNNNAAILLIPNPNSGRFTLRVPLETGETADITIYNMLGEKIVSHTATAATTELDITGYPKGMYVVNIAARDGKQSVVKMVYQ